MKFLGFFGVLSLAFLGFSDCTQECQDKFDLAYQQLRYAEQFCVHTTNDLTNLKSDYARQTQIVSSVLSQSGVAGDPSYSSQLSELQSLILSTGGQFDYLITDAEMYADELREVADELEDFDCNDCCDDGGGSGSSTNSPSGGGCPCSDLLMQIRDEIIDLHNHFELLRTRAYLHYDKMSDYVLFSTNWMGRVERRLQIPDDTLKSDIDDMFHDMADARLEFVSEIQNAASYADDLVSELSGVPLSNEGVIGLYNVSANWASYQASLRSAQLEELILTNVVALGFISNYLDKTQRNYYELFNQRFANPVITTSPFIGEYYQNVTNFWTFASRSQSMNQAAFIKYIGRGSNKGVTNWFDRIEFGLYGLAGMFDSHKVPDNLNANDVLNVYKAATNSVNFSGVSSVTGNVIRVFSTFLTAVDETFKPPRGSFSGNGGITVLPAFSIGGTHYEPLVLQYSELETYTNFIRKVLRVIWYGSVLVMAFILFRSLGKVFVKGLTFLLNVIKSLL